jgi:hypothetical protein
VPWGDALRINHSGGAGVSGVRLQNGAAGWWPINGHFAQYSRHASSFGLPQQQINMPEQILKGLFEQSQLMDPRKALNAAGANTLIVSPKSEALRG